MSTLRSASYALGVLVFAGVCAVLSIGGPKSALASGPRILFVSDKMAHEIAIFSLPDLTNTGMITGLNQPRGLCSTPSGAIWATDYGAKTIIQYSRTGTVLQTKTDPYGFPFSCADGALAVGNIKNMSGPGETLVYGMAYPPPSYDLAEMPNVRGVGYHGDPNLYIVGTTKTGTFVLAVLPSGSTTIHKITVTGGTINFPGMVQWYEDGNYLAVGDRKCGGSTPSTRTTCIYHIQLSKVGFTGKIIGTPTPLEAYNGKPICDMAQGEIGASGEKYLAGGDDETDCKVRGTKSGVYRWNFPSGGAPTNHNNSTLANPFGTAISATAGK